MPPQGRAWFHIIFGTYGSWLPGDPRGFRNRFHRIHSSGDYRNPPPPGEHSGLHRFSERCSRRSVVLATATDRDLVCDAIVQVATTLQLDCVSIAVGRVHAHLQIMLDEDRSHRNRELTLLKTKSSAAVRDRFPGRTWSRRWHEKPIVDDAHQRTTFNYIVEHVRKEGASVWTYRG